MEFLLFLIAFVVLFAIGMPIPFTMMVSSVLYALVGGIDLAFFSQEAFKSLYSFTLICIPMFMLTSEVMGSSTVADRMFDFANKFVGWIPGGMGHTNVVNSVIFAGMSGSAAADTSGIGLLEYNSMTSRGFDAPFSAAVTAASSCIGPIIPPSIPVVVYAMTVTAASVGSMFLAGVIPGLLMALAMMVYIYFVAKKRNYPVEPKPTRKTLWVAVKRGILPVLTPIVLLLTISSGIVTVSEGAVITVVYSMLLGGIIYRQYGRKQMINSFTNVAKMTGAILIFFMATKMFSYVITKEQVVTVLAQGLYSISQDRFTLMLIINAFFLIAGCLSDPIVNIMLFAPLAWSVVQPTGIDPNVFGMIIIFNAMIGLITPPVGGMAFLVSGVTGVPLQKVFKETMPFIIGFIVVLIVMSAIPDVVAFLPNLVLK